MSGLQSSLENTRGHLQKELRTKEADCNRMAVQIRVGINSTKSSFIYLFSVWAQVLKTNDAVS